MTIKAIWKTLTAKMQTNIREQKTFIATDNWQNEQYKAKNKNNKWIRYTCTPFGIERIYILQEEKKKK